jgi:hypothetical protein
MVAIGIFSMVLIGIYSSWTAILRSTKVGLDTAAAVQRSRIAIRTIEDSLGSAECFAVHQQRRHPEYYGFVGKSGNDGYLSFVARLSKSFPRSGKFGDADVRRVTFSIEGGSDSGAELVLRQNRLLSELDVDEKAHPLVLAKNVREFQLQFWDTRLNDWTDEWNDNQTNQLPKLIMVTLKLADNAQSAKPQEDITRIISLPSVAVQPLWQLPGGTPGAPGAPPVGQPNPPPGGLGQPGSPLQQPQPGIQPRGIARP